MNTKLIKKNGITTSYEVNFNGKSYGFLLEEHKTKKAIYAKLMEKETGKSIASCWFGTINGVGDQYSTFDEDKELHKFIVMEFGLPTLQDMGDDWDE